MSNKILIIESDDFLGKSLVDKLNSSGFEAELKTNGNDGLESLSKLPDLLILDLKIAGKDGMTILEEKLKKPELNRIPTIVISDSGEPSEINNLLSLNVKDYFVKAQFDPDEVVSKVKIQLREVSSDAIPSAPENIKKGGQSLSGKKVMWVEDDIFLSDIISRKLSNENAILVHATNGSEAISIVEKEKPDVILLDILLPGKSGFEILAELKAKDSTKNIPVILLSNLGQKSDIDKGEKLGAIKFLVKATVTLDEIVDEVKKVLQSK